MPLKKKTKLRDKIMIAYTRYYVRLQGDPCASCKILGNDALLGFPRLLFLIVLQTLTDGRFDFLMILENEL